jgi:hypothetical protein
LIDFLFIQLNGRVKGFLAQASLQKMII